MRDQREYARIHVTVPAQIQLLEQQEADALGEELLAGASIWAPTNESALHDLASGGDSNHALLAGALLELVSQVVALRAKLLQRPGTMYPVHLVELSGGGGRITTELPVNMGERFEMRFEDEDHGMPPVRSVIRVVHVDDQPQPSAGFTFDAIHTRDRERLIRMIYQCQREALRNRDTNSVIA